MNEKRKKQYRELGLMIAYYRKLRGITPVSYTHLRRRPKVPSEWTETIRRVQRQKGAGLRHRRVEQVRKSVSYTHLDVYKRQGRSHYDTFSGGCMCQRL